MAVANLKGGEILSFSLLSDVSPITMVSYPRAHHCRYGCAVLCYHARAIYPMQCGMVYHSRYACLLIDRCFVRRWAMQLFRM